MWPGGFGEAGSGLLAKQMNQPGIILVCGMETVLGPEPTPTSTKYGQTLIKPGPNKSYARCVESLSTCRRWSLVHPSDQALARYSARSPTVHGIITSWVISSWIT
jgi:hypothetical protein